MATDIVLAIVPCIWKLLTYELGLSESVKGGLTILRRELEGMDIFLEHVTSLAPYLELDGHTQGRANEVRELADEIEKSLDSFMASMQLAKDNLFADLSKRKINHQIDSYIKETQIKVKSLRDKHGTYPSKSLLESTCKHKGDPRITLYTTEFKPVGIAGAIADLTEKLSKREHVSIAGMAGMGKTTLARAVYEKMKIEGEFDCEAFVPIGQGVSQEKVLKHIFCELRQQVDGNELSEQKVSDQLQIFLKDKRYLLVIDDLWDEDTWTLIKNKCVGSDGSKIIITSRNRKIPKGFADDDVYKIRPLSTDESKNLLRTKILGAEAKDSDDFNELSNKILPKCDGVPMTISWIGSLFRKKPVGEWNEVYHSIGFDDHMENQLVFQKVVEYSYTDLPGHLKKCFLYLSLFPEGQWIEKNMLIWMWVADGLVVDLSFETGEGYLEQLIGRSMIQWAVSPGDVGQGGCRVHSLMFPLLLELSSTQNFSTVLGSKAEPSPKKAKKQENTSKPRHIHRLAIRETINQNTGLEVGKVLSFCASTCPGDSLPPLQNFGELCVIDLEAVEDPKLEHLGKLKKLKYVRLVSTPMAKLPAGKGCFKVLETLDVTATSISKLPSFVEDLGTLRCLRAGKGTSMVGRVGKLTLLEELCLHSADKSPDFTADLGNLTELRVLIIHFDEVDQDMQKKLVESLGCLNKLQVLQIWFDTEGKGKGKVRLEGWEEIVPYPELRQLLLFGAILPEKTLWIQHSRAPKLSRVLLQVETLTALHLEMLGKMQSLSSLYLHSEDNSLSYIAGGKSKVAGEKSKVEFQKLEYLNTNIELTCGENALPKIQELEIGRINVKAGTDVGLQGNMPQLERATYHLDCKGCSTQEVQDAEEKLRQASRDHRNKPALSIKRWNNVGVQMQHLVEEVLLMAPVIAKTLVIDGVPSSKECEKCGKQCLGSATGRSTASSLLGHPAIRGLLSDNIAGIMTAAAPPPTLRMGSATEDTGSPSEYAGGATPRRPDGEGQFQFTRSCVSTPTKGKAEVSTEKMSAQFYSQIASATGAGFLPPAFAGMMTKCAGNPEFLASLNSMASNADGYMPASNISKMIQVIEPDMVEILGQCIDDDADGLSPSQLAHQLFGFMQSLSGTASVAQGVGAAPMNGQGDVEKLLRMLEELIPAVEQPSAAGEISGKPSSKGLSGAPVDANTLKQLLSSMEQTFAAGASSGQPSSAQGLSGTQSGEDFSTVMMQVLPMFQQLFTATVSNGGPSSAQEGLSGVIDSSSILATSAAQGVAMTRESGQDDDADSMSARSVAQGAAATPESGQDDGENFSRMLRQVMPALKRAHAAGASSGQPSSAEVDADSKLSHGGPADASNMLSGLSSNPALAAHPGMMDAIATSTASAAQTGQDGENSTTIVSFNERLAALEKASAASEKNGQPCSAQLHKQDNVGEEEGSSA